MALVWPWGGFVLRSLCLVYAYNMALGWLWVALRGRFLLSTFCFLLLPECGFPARRTAFHDSTPRQASYGRVVYQVAEPSEGGIGFLAFGGDEVEQLGGSAGVFL